MDLTVPVVYVCVSVGVGDVSCADVSAGGGGDGAVRGPDG